MRPRRKPQLVAAIVAIVLGAPATWGAATWGAEVGEGIVGSDGAVHRLLIKTYGEVFPDGDALPAENSVLVLEQLGPSTLERLIVPGSEGDDREISASLIYERRSQTLYAIWSSVFGIHTRLTLASLRDGVWSQPIEIYGNPYSRKTYPHLAVTHEVAVEIAENGALTRHRERTMAHVIWWDSSYLGKRLLYLPLVLNGELEETPEPIALDELFATDGELGPSPAAELQLATSIRGGSARNRLLITFADPETGLLAVVESEPVALELTSLAAALKEQIVTAGRASCVAGGGPVAIADAARAQIIMVGRKLMHRSVVDFIANTVASHITSGGGSLCLGIDALAESAAEVLIVAGEQALTEGIVRQSSAARAQIIMVGRSGQSGHRIKLRPAFLRAAPVTPERPTSVLASYEGTEVVVAWEDEDGLSYIEATSDGGWSEVAVVPLDQHLSRDQALAALQRRLASP